MANQSTKGKQQPDRVAVVAIHGVADQERGQTARAVASLLINSPIEEASYRDGNIGDYILSVEPMEAMCPTQPRTAPRAATATTTASTTAPDTKPGAAPTTAKKLKQSVRSDFMRKGWVTVKDGASGAAAESKPGPQADQGVEFSDYLLFKAKRNGATAEPYEGTRIRMTRTSTIDGEESTQKVDVHEMYWADLSRLSGQLPRIVSELFTLVFRFSRLGRDAVDHSTRMHLDREGKRHGRWKTLSYLQRTLDTAFMALLTNMFIQLLLLASFIMAMHVIASRAPWLPEFTVYGAAVLAAGWCIYRYARSYPMRLAIAALAACSAWLLLQIPAPYLAGIMVLSLLGLLLDAAWRIGDTRFPGTRVSGWAFFGLTIVLMLTHLQVRDAASTMALVSADWIVAALRVFEYTLLAIVVWWGCVPFLMLAWLLAGWHAAGKDNADRRSVATGRIGLFVSITAFLICCMVLWRLIEPGVEAAAGGIRYQPFAFFDGHAGEVGAREFLHNRFVNSTVTFSLIAGMLFLVLLHLTVMLVPSIFAETKRNLGTSENLGRWLTAGYLGLELLIPLIVGLGVVVAGATGMLQLLPYLGFPIDPALSVYIGAIREFSSDALEPLVYATATVAAALTALGKWFSRYVPSLRAPLDVALDVDNHFREFPRHAIPRARIFARYIALLEHLVAQGYDRIVIVAHSQGSVISAELLRYLMERARIQGAQQSHESDRIVRLWSQLKGKVDLLTAGNPLRQLYAARFPALYEWVGVSRLTDEGGPPASAIGVRRWINLYTTGDYVGRWIWAKQGQDLYEAADPEIADQLDVCLGSGAHTHYFDPDQVKVAGWVDRLVAGPPAREQPLLQLHTGTG